MEIRLSGNGDVFKFIAKILKNIFKNIRHGIGGLLRMNAFNVVGRSISRHNIYQKVTGKEIFCNDLKRSGMLYAKPVFSKYPHAKILKINTEMALKLEGVEGIITAEDVPHNRYGLTHQDQRVLADDKVRYIGDVVAVVAAKTLKISTKAVELVEVEYKPLTPVFDPIQAMDKGAPLVHEKSNIAAHIMIKNGDIEKGFQDADYIIEERFYAHKVKHASIEPHVAMAEIENDGKLVIWTTNSRPFMYATQIANVLKMSMTKFQIKTPTVGGCFGGKSEIIMEPWVALLALKTGKPVKMVFTRKEEFLATTLRHPYIMKYKSGIKKDGTLIAREVEIISDSGAYVSYGKSVLLKASIHCIGPYNIPNVKISSYLVYTNTAFGGSMRGFGVPQVCFAYESHTDSLAHRLNIDPLEFRIKNGFGKQGIMPTEQRINSNPLRMTLEKALELEGSNYLYGGEKDGKKER